MTSLKSAPPRATQAKEHSTVRQIDWLRFPTLEQVFREDSSQAIALAETEQRRYKALSEAGSTSERVRARLGAVCYGHAIALLRELEKARTKPIEGQQHKQLHSR